MRAVALVAPLLAMLLLPSVAAADGVKESDVFVAREGGYHMYRIPAIVVATNGAVLAFCEGRKSGAGDAGDIDLLLKRSVDGGKTWESARLLFDDGSNIVGCPAPVVDRVTGEIFLLTTWGLGADTERLVMNGTAAEQRRVYVQSSKNNGATWSKPRDISANVKKAHWRWYSTGPVNGIQLVSGKHRGRLVIPANHSDHSDPAKHPYRSHVIYSDDHGVTWKIGAVHDEKTNESTVVELSDGTVLQNMRSYHGKNCRAIATSADGGLSFGPVTLATNLVEPVCQASLFRLQSGEILFANPASTKREKMTIQISKDGAKSWTTSHVLHAGPSAYSCLAQLADGTVLCLYERGEKSPYEKIRLASISRRSLQ